MFSVCKTLLELLTPKERISAISLIFLLIVVAIMDVLGVASIMPFMAILINPENIQNQKIINYFYIFFDFKSEENFLFFLGGLTFLLLLVSTIFKTISSYAQMRFTLMREYSISKRLIGGYLSQPYSWFLGRHSSDLGKSILSEVNQVIGGAFIPVMQIFANGFIIVFIVLLLLIVNPYIALIIGGALGGAYLLIYFCMRRYLGVIGKARLLSNEARFKVVAEAFGGIKDVKVYGLEYEYISRFKLPAEDYAKKQVAATVIAQLPRYLLEVLAFGGLLLIALFSLSSESDGKSSTLPIIALYAFAGYRLMPALQQFYAYMSSLKFTAPTLEALYAEFKTISEIKVKLSDAIVDVVKFEDSISLRALSFAYPNTDQKALNGLSLEIIKGKKIGLVGKTGSGKTTIVDVILGLLSPQSGEVLVDGLSINTLHPRLWRKMIGYVSQQIFLLDDTVTANIAFGVRPEEIDMDRIRHAAKIARINDFIEGTLTQGYSAIVGERGIKLSGGQRQRIGIARAIYGNPKLIILDEATSALDNLTEHQVMELMREHNKEATFIVIAHRLSTVKDCDVIYVVEDGAVTAKGKFEDLINQSSLFNDLYKPENLGNL